jgi:hypothetical protein
MNRRLALLTGFIAMSIGSVAGAQEVTIGYQGLPYKSSGESNTGIQVSEGALLHVGAGAEAGYDTNVFYQPSGNALGSGIVRVMPYAELTNASRTGPVSRDLNFDLRAALMYRRYLTTDPGLAEMYRNAWLPTAGAALSIGGGQVSFSMADTFARLQDPPYGPVAVGVTGGASGPWITRDNNQASAEVRWAPGGGRLATVLRYTNMIDVFEGTYSFASTDGNYLMLDIAWKWLPKTAIFVNAQQGYIFYINNDLSTLTNGMKQKVSSYPLVAAAGLRGLLTEKTSATLTVGYTNGFYSSGATTSGFWGSTYIDAALTVRPTQLSRIVGGYRHEFVNAVVSTFSNNDSVYLSYVQQIAGRFALDLSGRYSHIDYQGTFVDNMQMVTGRTDNLVQVGASLDYFMRNWVYAGIAYSLISDTVTSATGMSLSNLDYLKQQMFVRLGITY